MGRLDVEDLLVGGLGPGEVAGVEGGLGGVEPRSSGSAGSPSAAPGTAPPVAPTSSVTNCRACSSGMAPGELGDELPLPHGLHRGDALHPQALGQVRVGVDVDLRQHPRPAAFGGELLEHRESCLHGPHHSAHRSSTTGTWKDGR